MTEFERQYPDARSKEQAPGHWPAGVKQITMEGLDLLGLDAKGQIYWDGKPLQIKKLRLTGGQTVWAAIVGAAAIIGGLGSGLNDGFELLCKRQLLTEYCSTEPAAKNPSVFGTLGSSKDENADRSSPKPT